MSARIVYLPVSYYDPPEHDCPLDECDGTDCQEAFAHARLDAMIERADALRKGDRDA